MSSKHTPGPWKVLDGAILSDKINAYGNWHICTFARGDEANTPEDHANARLIAAAPDLLAACKALHAALTKIPDLGRHYQEINEDMDAARSAIARAEGGGNEPEHRKRSAALRNGRSPRVAGTGRGSGQGRTAAQ